MGTLKTYEVAVDSGSFFDVESISGRYLFSGLTRQTRHTFKVRAQRTDNTYGDEATVTGKTPIASLNNALFFRDCVNLEGEGERVAEHGVSTNVLREAADNDLETYTDETDIDIDISDGSNPTRVHAVYLISSGVTAYTGTPTGGTGTGWASRRPPLAVNNWEGTQVSTVVDNRVHDLYLLDNSFTATSVRVQLTGTGVRVYEIYLLQFGIELDANGDFVEINPDFVDRTAVLHEGVDGSILRETGLGGRHRWQVQYLAKFVPDLTEIQQSDIFLRWMEQNLNCFHFQEFTRYPARGYPASFMDSTTPVRLRGDSKLLGDVIRFRVGER